MNPATNQNGTSTVTLTVSDGSLQAQDTFVLTVTAVNDAPTINNIVNQSTNEDTVLNNVAFTISDIDSTISCTSTSNITFTSTNTTLLPVANITRGGTYPNCMVSMNPATNQNGTSTVTVTVSDGSLNNQDTFILTVTAVNDAPVIVNFAKSTNEDATMSFTLTDFSSNYADIENTPLNKIKIVTLPNGANGVLKLSGVNVTAGDEILSTNIANLTFVPTTDYNGSASLIRQASDGTDYSSMMEAVTITVNALNDAPIVNDFNVNTDEDVIYTFTQGNFT